jgi:hypothetical protein
LFARDSPFCERNQISLRPSLASKDKIAVRPGSQKIREVPSGWALTLLAIARHRTVRAATKCYLFAFLIGATLQATGAEPDLGAYIDSYTARLSERDHFNSNGQRLASAAAIIRQDRANFYVYGVRDPEDQADSFFSRKANRESLEKLLQNGTTTPQAIARIVNGIPVVRTDIYERGITVTILSD